MTGVGYACLMLALVLLAAAKSRYTVQPPDERGPLARTLAYGVVGLLLALAALFLIPGER